MEAVAIDEILYLFGEITLSIDTYNSLKLLVLRSCRVQSGRDINFHRRCMKDKKKVPEYLKPMFTKCLGLMQLNTMDVFCTLSSWVRLISDKRTTSNWFQLRLRWHQVNCALFLISFASETLGAQTLFPLNCECSVWSKFILMPIEFSSKRILFNSWAKSELSIYTFQTSVLNDIV